MLGRTSIEIGTFTSESDRRTFVEPLLATGSVRNVERKIKHRSGRSIDVVYSAECFELGGVMCALTIIRDITELKQAEAALIANEERFRSFVEHAKDVYKRQG